MTGKKNPQDENLIKQLHEKLDWYTNGEDEQFNAEEVDAILKLLDVLEPLEEDSFFSADNAWKRFEERYDLQTEKEEAQSGPARDADLKRRKAAGSEPDIVDATGGTEDTADAVQPRKRPESRSASRIRNLRSRNIMVRLAVGVAACLVMLVTVNVGTFAVVKKSFFEVVTDSLGGRKVTVTGNMDEQENTVISYESWEELEADVGEKFLKPEYLPEGYELGEITLQKMVSTNIIIARYDRDNKTFRIRISVYDGEYSERMQFSDEEWKFLYENKGGKKEIYYTNGEEINAIFIENNLIYSICMEEAREMVESVVVNMKY